MNPDGDPEIVEEMADSINGARGHADHEAHAPAAQQKRETRDWIVQINNRLHEEYADAERYRYFGAPAKNENEMEPSIFLTGRPPNKFYIGYLLRHYRDQSDMWEYAAFMTEKFGLDVNGCLEFMEENEELVLDYYDNEYKAVLIKRSQNFLESLLVAGCFQCFAILALIGAYTAPDYLMPIISDPMYNILIAKIQNEATQARLDMLSPRNQIPWIITKAVYTRSILNNANFRRVESGGTLNTIESLAVAAFENLYPRANKSKVTNLTFPQQGFLHLLDLFHWTRTPSELKYMPEISSTRLQKRFGEFFIPNATELLGSTTVFQKLDGASGCDVKFSEKTIRAVMQLGPLHLFPYSHELYHDLIIFEQKTRGYHRGYPVTAHFACMKSLLQTKEDVKLLQKNGIVQNILQGEKDVLNFVHDMGRFLVEELDSIIPDELDALSRQVMEHHERSVSRAYTEIKNQFCPSKWVLISIIAAFVLFVLTFIQTIYTGLGYYKT